MRGMVAALFGDDIDRDAAINREVLLHAVQRQIMCMAEGGVLDVRRAVLVTIIRDGINLATMIVTGDKFDELGGVEHVRAVAEKYAGTFEIIDGREYQADGTLTKAARAAREADRAEAQAEATPTPQGWDKV